MYIRRRYFPKFEKQEPNKTPIIFSLVFLFLLFTTLSSNFEQSRKLFKFDKHKLFKIEKENEAELFELAKRENAPCIMQRKPNTPELWVLVTSENAGEFLPTLIESIHRQRVPVRALYVDDASADNSVEWIKAELRDGDELIDLDERLGPAGAKFIGFDYLKKMVDKNDVVVVLDADEYFVSRDATKTILEEYTGRDAKVN